MGNEIANSNNKTVREKVLKKAAVLATVASITGACAIGGQQPKESKALIGAIIGIITGIVSVTTGVATAVQDGVSQAEQARQAKLQAEEEARLRREAEEQERIRVALESSGNNVRIDQQLQQDTETSSTVKEIDISIANNDELMSNNSSRVSMYTTGINRVSIPKGISVGGFGASSSSEKNTSDKDNVNSAENNQTTIEDGQNVDSADKNDNSIVDDVVNDNIQEDVSEISDSDVNDMGTISGGVTSGSNTIGSNIVRFNIKDLDIDDGFSGNSISDIVKEEVFAGGLGLIDGYDSSSEEEEYVEIDESMLMSEEDAQEHMLVKEGLLSVEDLIILDFGIRSGAINEEILSAMYENGDINDEYYKGAISLMNQIYDEIAQDSEDKLS